MQLTIHKTVSTYMRKTIFILTLLCFTLTVYAQKNKLLDELKKVKGVNEQVSCVLNFPVKNLDKITLTKKLGSELNTIASCITPFVNSKQLGLTESETAELKKRIEIIATKLFKSNNYTFLKKFRWICSNFMELELTLSLQNKL